MTVTIIILVESFFVDIFRDLLAPADEVGEEVADDEEDDEDLHVSPAAQVRHVKGDYSIVKLI